MPEVATCRVLVLGTAQDGGIPQLGCACASCRDHRRYGRRRYVASLLVTVTCAGRTRRVLVDATPDLRYQLDAVAGATGSERADRCPVDAVLLTHLHMGHAAGLLELGREVIAARAVPVFCTAAVAQVLGKNAPWSLLVANDHIRPDVVVPGAVFAPVPGLRVEAVRVPHRDELGDTVGYLLGPHGGGCLLYIPDADTWSGVALPELLARVDYALLDGTFYSHDELPGGRAGREVPHPPVPETMARAAGAHARVFFTHLNHTNPLTGPEPAARARVTGLGFGLAHEGMVFDLSTPPPAAPA